MIYEYEYYTYDLTDRFICDSWWTCYLVQAECKT